jgi:hypothetical protein
MEIFVATNIWSIDPQVLCKNAELSRSRRNADDRLPSVFGPDGGCEWAVVVDEANVPTPPSRTSGPHTFLATYMVRIGVRGHSEEWTLRRKMGLQCQGVTRLHTATKDTPQPRIPLIAMSLNHPASSSPIHAPTSGHPPQHTRGSGIASPYHQGGAFPPSEALAARLHVSSRYARLTMSFGTQRTHVGGGGSAMWAANLSFGRKPSKLTW